MRYSPKIKLDASNTDMQVYLPLSTEELQQQSMPPNSLRPTHTLILPSDILALLAASNLDHLPGIAAAIVLHIHNLLIRQRAVCRHCLQHLVLTALLTACKEQNAGKKHRCIE
jgi:hypothetical protein